MSNELPLLTNDAFDALPDDIKAQVQAAGDGPQKVSGFGGIASEVASPKRAIDDPFGAGAVASIPGGSVINGILMAIQGDDRKTPLERVGSAIGAEILSIPGMVAGMAGIAEMGIRTATGTDINAAALSDTGVLKYNALMDPEIPDEIKQQVAAEFTSGDLNWGLRNLSENVEWARDFTEVERLEDGTMPLGDELSGVVGAAFVGAPKAAITRVAQSIAKAAGKNAAGRFALGVANSRIGRGAIRAVEVSTPLTLPLSPGNVAANAGVGLALTDVSRALSGETSITNTIADVLTNEDVPPLTAMQLTEEAKRVQAANNALPSLAQNQPLDDLDKTPWDKYALLGIGSVAAVSVLAAVAGRPARPMFSAGGSVNDTSSANPNRTDILPPAGATGPHSGQLDQIFGNRPGVQVRTRLQNSARPVSAAIEETGVSSETMEALLAGATRAGAEQQLHTVHMHGKFSDGTRVVPLAGLNKMYTEMSNKPNIVSPVPDNAVTTQRQLADAYVYAHDAKRYRDVANANLARTIGRAQAALNATTPNPGHNLAGHPTQWQRRADRIQELIDIYNNDVRMSLTKWDDAALDRIIALGNADPAIVKFKQAVENIMDGTLTYRVNRGELTRTQATQLRNRWGNDIVPLHEADTGTAGRAPGVGLWGHTQIAAKRVGKLAFDQPKDKAPVANLDSTREVGVDTVKLRQDTPEMAVNNPMPVMKALERHLGHTVRYVEANDLRKQIIDQLMNSADTRDAVRLAVTKTRAEVNSGNYPKNPHYLPVHRGGKVEFYEFGDDLLRQSLDFSPNATLGMMNTSRTIWQQMTTGKFAPWFAPKGLLFDITAAAVSKRKDMHLGFIDGALGAASNNRLHLQGDPTAFLDALLNGSARQISADVFLRDFGEWFANHLGNSNTMFARLMDEGAKAFGAAGIKAVGEAMLNRYMRTTVGVLRNEGHFGDNSTFMRNPVDTLVDNADFRFSLAGRAYMSVLEGIHNGAKMAMFARGMSHLRRVHKGQSPSSPAFKTDILKLSNEVRSIAGDMSKQGSSKILSAASAAMPYANVTIQSMAHMADAYAKHPVRSTQGLFTAIGAPAVAGLSMMSVAGEETMDWYYNKLTGWQRSGNIVLPRPSALLRVMREDYEHDPNDWVLIPIAPELVPLKEMFMAGVEMLYGYRENASVKDGMWRDLREGVGSVFNIVTPPTVNAAFEFSGARLDLKNLAADGRSPIMDKQKLSTAAFDEAAFINSEVHKNTADGISALFGTAMAISMNMYHAFDHQRDNDVGWVDSMFAALSEGEHEVKRRVPVANTAVWEKSTQYSSTPLVQTYYETMNDLSPVFRQFDVGIDGMVGDSKTNTRVTAFSEMPGQIKHDVDGIPALEIESLVAQSELIFNNDVLKHQTDRMSAIVREKEQVRSNFSTRPQQRLEKLNELENERQVIAKTVHETYVDQWMDMMEERFGRPVAPKEFTELVRRSIYGS